jgi:hypothetical protein
MGLLKSVWRRGDGGGGGGGGGGGVAAAVTLSACGGFSERLLRQAVRLECSDKKKNLKRRM